MQKLKIDVSNLFAVNDGLLLGATAIFDIEIIDASGLVVGYASVDLRGKIGGNGGKSSYVKEFEIDTKSRARWAA